MTEAPTTQAGALIATHVRQRTVYFGEDDGSKLIFFPTYYHYMAESDQELFDTLGFSVARQIDEGMGAPVVHSDCDYLKPVCAGSVLTQRTELRTGRTTSLTTSHEWSDEDGTPVARGRTVRVWVDLGSMQKKRLPEWLRVHPCSDPSRSEGHRQP